jgi:DNA-binding MarR family transcriptional regulator
VSEPRWLNPQEARAWRGFQSMRSQLGGRLRRQLVRDAGLSDADYEVLVNLSEAPDLRLRLYELGRRLQWEKSRVSHHLTRMERRGLVARQSCATDGRGAFVVLTDSGLAAIRAAAPQHVDAVRQYFIDVLTPAQLEALSEITEAVAARLAQADDDGDGF